MSHPDRFAGASTADIAAATAEFIRISEAKDTLISAAGWSVQDGPAQAPLKSTGDTPLPQDYQTTFDPAVVYAWGPPAPPLTAHRKPLKRLWLFGVLPCLLTAIVILTVAATVSRDNSPNVSTSSNSQDAANPEGNVVAPPAPEPVSPPVPDGYTAYDQALSYQYSDTCHIGGDATCFELSVYTDGQCPVVEGTLSLEHSDGTQIAVIDGSGLQLESYARVFFRFYDSGVEQGRVLTLSCHG